ncbi:hypothetical protein [Nonlabens ulvanivorans]|uniref:hypothetical protein n=1 Tax=Nonlabens ulvanivorans TaxID=906888 RepID=UPI0037C95305
MKDSTQMPSLLSSKSLVILTKFMAIYAAFHIITVLGKTYVDSLSEESTIVDSYQLPIYIVAGVHFIMLLICGAMLMTKKYFWLVTVACIVISLYTRFFFEDIVTWVN